MSGDVLTPEERAEVEEIRRAHDRVTTDSGPAYAAHGDRAVLLRIIDRLSTPQVPEWRPVTEVEPAIDEHFAGAWMVQGTTYDVALSVRRESDRWYEMEGGLMGERDREVGAPSHWMPLPTAPGANHIGEPTAMVDEVARLREAIEQAPHALGCAQFYSPDCPDCTCWKSPVKGGINVR